jgi:DNA-binding response OmpR family regulator
MYRILIVEDDSMIAKSVQDYMQTWGLEVKCVENFRNILTEFSAYSPHLVLMDISLPFFNGYHWCGEIRKVSKLPLIFMSSASDNMNILMAINMGGDDFIAKPFDLEILMAKVQAVLRRTYDFNEQIHIMEHRGAMLNTADASLVYQGEKIDLSRNEYRILETLLEHKGMVVSREKLIERLWESDSFIDENTLSVNVNRLRKKLDTAGLTKFITTKVGMGYLIK